MHNFDQMVKDHFFSTNEILLGKSMCELCLRDPRAIKNALKKVKPCYNYHLKGTILEDIFKNDKMRSAYLLDMQYIRPNSVINLDFNY